LFEKKYEQLVTEGSLLCFDSDGKITIDEHGWDYPDSICSDYNRQFDDSFTENFNHFCAIPPINYAARDECVTICLVDDDASMREAIDKYNTVIVVKSPVSPSLTFNGYAVKIARLNNELELKNQLIKELQDSRNGHGVGSGTIAWVLFFIVIFLVLISIFTGVLTIQL
jgi:hypothetical protein